MSKMTIHQRAREGSMAYVCGTATAEQQFDTEWSGENAELTS